MVFVSISLSFNLQHIGCVKKTKQQSYHGSSCKRFVIGLTLALKWHCIGLKLSRKTIKKKSQAVSHWLNTDIKVVLHWLKTKPEYNKAVMGGAVSGLLLTRYRYYKRMMRMILYKSTKCASEKEFIQI